MHLHEEGNTNVSSRVCLEGLCAGQEGRRGRMMDGLRRRAARRASPHEW